MPFDGIVTKCVVLELTNKLLGGRIEKVFQPEADEIRINIRAQGNNYKLLASASPNNPRLHITDSNKENPSAPPVFCMLLRKHLSGGKILSIDFHDFERIITVNMECITELGDTVIRRLIVEIMGKYSNIILTTEQGIIIDAIKHVDNEMSRVREVMPARHYVLPPSQDKISPLDINFEDMFPAGNDNEAASVATLAVSVASQVISVGNQPVSVGTQAASVVTLAVSATNNAVSITLDKYILNNVKGFSPLICREVCFRADIDPKIAVETLTSSQLASLKVSFTGLIGEIRDSSYSPRVLYNEDNAYVPIDFYCINLKSSTFVKEFDSISEAMDNYYFTRDRLERSKQKKAQLDKTLGNCLDRCYKKLAIREEAIRNVEDRDNIRLFGELITANIHCISKGTDSVSVLNYYSEDEEYIDIPVKSNLTPQENAQRYFKRYTKAKSTFEQTNKQIIENLDEAKYLESVAQLLDTAESVQEIDDIRQELIDEGYIKGKRKIAGNKKVKASAPLSFMSSDGFQIFVGRNNKQNDTLTLKSSSSNDLWFHVKSFPGSHVIIKTEGQDVSETTMTEAAMIAAYYSKARSSSGVNVDYTKVRYVKKPSGAKPGMVIYTDFKTITTTPDERKVDSLKVP